MVLIETGQNNYMAVPTAILGRLAVQAALHFSR
jgi:hypothetical protein